MLATYEWKKLLKDTDAAAGGDDQNAAAADDDNNDDSDGIRNDALCGKVNPLDAIDRLVAHFRVPLEQSNAITYSIQEEFKICAHML